MNKGNLVGKKKKLGLPTYERKADQEIKILYQITQNRVPGKEGRRNEQKKTNRNRILQIGILDQEEDSLSGRSGAV